MTSVTVKHKFAASAERVFDAWLDPEKAREFLFTTAGGQIVRCDVDARVGGTYAIVDRRAGEDVLHEGTYLELERPRRLVFTLRVPKYSAAEDRVTIEIEPLRDGCELTLTTQTPDEWADATQRGWTMILDVLDTIVAGDAASCGAGLAQHAVVPRRIAVYLAELAETLALHRDLLVLDDPAAKNEDEIYAALAAGFRESASKLGELAARMDAQRYLPLGAHDESKWSSVQAQAFARFVHEQSALASVLNAAAKRDGDMLASMQKPGAQ